VTLLFSATIPPEIKDICVKYMKKPLTVETESSTKTVDTVSQRYYRVGENEKLARLHQLLLLMRPESCMVFCNTKIAVDRVTRYLNKKGHACRAIHGDIPQGRRLETMRQFKEGAFRILVATDVAARGIHVEGLSLVVNFDVPNDKDSYIHRIGRTGRAGQAGQAVSLVTRDDIMTLYEIEEHIGVLIEEAEWPVERPAGRINIVNRVNNGKHIWVAAKPSLISAPATAGRADGPKGASIKAFIRNLLGRLSKRGLKQ